MYVFNMYIRYHKFGLENISLSYVRYDKLVWIRLIQFEKISDLAHDRHIKYFKYFIGNISYDQTTCSNNLSVFLNLDECNEGFNFGCKILPDNVPIKKAIHVITRKFCKFLLSQIVEKNILCEQFTYQNSIIRTVTSRSAVTSSISNRNTYKCVTTKSGKVIRFPKNMITKINYTSYN